MFIIGWRIMYAFDGDEGIDEFAEELTEYELQLLEDEMFFEEMEKRGYPESGHEADWGKVCGYVVLIAIGFFLLVLFIALLGR